MPPFISNTVEHLPLCLWVCVCVCRGVYTSMYMDVPFNICMCLLVVHFVHASIFSFET